jgi:FKBP-type peptidyl-prolyl cis-trans isomerase
MREGGTRELTVPPDLAYGPDGYPPVIPPDATLTFEIRMISIDT